MNKQGMVWSTLGGWIIKIIIFLVVMGIIIVLLGEKKDTIWNGLTDLLSNMFSGGFL